MTSARRMAAAVGALLVVAPVAGWPQDQQQAPPTRTNEPPKAETPPTLQLPVAATLSANPQPASFDVGALGPLYVTGVVSGFSQWQTNQLPSDRTWQWDINNAHVFLNKPTGMLQYFVQLGYYSLPAVGVPYLRTRSATPTFFTPFPQGYVKFVPNDKLSLMAGKLPTLIGAESTFTFQNTNVQRGLLWNQENAVNRGVQLNYTDGPATLAVAWHDGFYSNRYTWLSLSATYALDKSNTLSAVAGGNTRHTDVSTIRTPLFQNNQRIYNLIYTRADGPWTIQPYVQYTEVPKLPEFGANDSATTLGAAILATYDLGADAAPPAIRVPGLKLPVRLEFIRSAGRTDLGAPNLLYGPGSAAWSITLTPTYQYKKFFARAEVSYVSARKAAPGLAFGTDGNKGTQTRAVFELGMLL